VQHGKMGRSLLSSLSSVRLSLVLFRGTRSSTSAAAERPAAATSAERQGGPALPVAAAGNPEGVSSRPDFSLLAEALARAIQSAERTAAGPLMATQAAGQVPDGGAPRARSRQSAQVVEQGMAPGNAQSGPAAGDMGAQAMSSLCCPSVWLRRLHGCT